jgi:hypothetical protein
MKGTAAAMSALSGQAGEILKSNSVATVDQHAGDSGFP